MKRVLEGKVDAAAAAVFWTWLTAGAKAMADGAAARAATAEAKMAAENFILRNY